MSEKKVSIELTNEQQKQIASEIGVDVDRLQIDALEDRVTPSIFAGQRRVFDMSRLRNADNL